jgi:hypothetical protein
MTTKTLLLIGLATCALAAAPRPQTQSVRPAVVVKAANYVESYEARLGGLVAEENYSQHLLRDGQRAPAGQKRKLKSDFMLVKFGADEPFTPYRDVLEVDGAPVADRTTRLEQLFLQPGAEARTSAAKISNESARYNLGRSKRNINVPTLALEYLKAANIARCRFQTPRAEQIGYDDARKVDFKEVDGPTVIKDSGTGKNVPASGTFWIRDSDGAVIRTVLKVGGRLIQFEIDVKYCEAPKIDVLVPCRMSERLRGRGETIEGTATYANIRQFTVTTSETIKR